MSKVEAGMMTVELEPVELDSLLSDSLSMVRKRATAQGVRLELETGDDLGIQQLDMRKTKQIVYNLLSNAVKFSTDRGPVTMSERRAPRHVVETLPGIWPVRSFTSPVAEAEEFLELRITEVIEDNPANMKLASLLLRNAGHTTPPPATPRPG